MPRSQKWSLADRLDFEALVAADERASDPAAITARDSRLWHEKIAPSLTPEQATDRSAVFHRWVEVRRPNETLPGKWFNAAFIWSNSLAILGGLALGFIVASGALHYSGSRPVNVAVFAVVTVGVQWILLLWSLAVIFSQGIRTASQHFLARIGELLGQGLAGALQHLSSEQRLRLRAELANLRQLSGRNLRPLGWAPLIAMQNFGICWNIGVILALLARVAFTDVGFGWESTLAQGPDGMYSLVHALAVPWSIFGGYHGPTLEQVQQSWFHYQSGVAALDRQAMASWWPWLLMLVLVYGLLPRALLRFYFGLRLSFSMRPPTFDEPRHRAAWHRLTGPVIHGDRPAHDSFPAGDSTATSPAIQKTETASLLIASSLSSARGEIEQWVTNHLGWKLTGIEVVEIDYPSGNDAALSRLVTASPGKPCWLLVAPAPFTAFAAFTQFISRIGQLSGSDTKSEGLVVVITLDAQGKLRPPDAEWTRYWSDYLRAESIDWTMLPFSS